MVKLTYAFQKCIDFFFSSTSSPSIFSWGVLMTFTILTGLSRGYCEDGEQKYYINLYLYSMQCFHFGLLITKVSISLSTICNRSPHSEVFETLML